MHIHVITMLNLAELVGSFLYKFYFLGNTTTRKDALRHRMPTATHKKSFSRPILCCNSQKNC